MSKTKKRKKRNKNKQIIIITICVCTCLLLLLLGLLSHRTNYKIENRDNNIKKEQEKDTEALNTIGWLRVQGTQIDMPIVSLTSNIEAPIEKESYAWILNNDAKYHNSIRILGHNIFNLSAKPKIHSPKYKRFEELLAFFYYDFAKENQYIQLTIDNKDHLYKIFAVGMIDYKKLDELPTVEHTKEEIKNEIDLFRDNSIYDYNTRVTKNDNLLSLITCTRMYGREADIGVVISAKEVKNHKINKLSRIKKNKKYKELEKHMEEADSDEEISA